MVGEWGLMVTGRRVGANSRLLSCFPAQSDGRAEFGYDTDSSNPCLSFMAVLAG